MSRITDKDCILIHNFFFFLMLPVKLATLGLFKIKIFQDKGYEVIISFHDVTNKILSRDSNYVMDVVM